MTTLNIVVDGDDAWRLERFDWQIGTHGYAYRREKINGKWVLILLHREIMACSNDRVIDHINGNVLDNRRNNLRECSLAENLRNRKTHKNNRTGLKGVYCDQRRKNKPWHAQIRVDGKKVYLGSFAASAEAFAAYVAAARKYHGEFARFA